MNETSMELVHSLFMIVVKLTRLLNVLVSSDEHLAILFLSDCKDVIYGE